jgi:hypothetical protein
MRQVGLCKLVGPIVGSKLGSHDHRQARPLFLAREYPPFGAQSVVCRVVVDAALN